MVSRVVSRFTLSKGLCCRTVRRCHRARHHVCFHSRFSELLNRPSWELGSGSWLGMSSKFLAAQQGRRPLILSTASSTMLTQLMEKVCFILLARAAAHPSLAGPWQALVGALCQLVLIMMANTFMASRSVTVRSYDGCQLDRFFIPSIYRLTRSRLQSAVALAFSVAAFITGIVTLEMTWKANP
jgi:hypothetical protein